jgi:hypothetical protein
MIAGIVPTGTLDPRGESSFENERKFSTSKGDGEMGSQDIKLMIGIGDLTRAGGS